MPDLLGLALLLLPLGLYLAWRGLSALPIPPVVVAATIGVLLALFATIAWYGFVRAIPAGESYRPAQLRGGRILPGGPAR